MKRGQEYRTFKVVSALKNNCPTKVNSNATYVSKNPMSAAKKAFSGLCNKKRIRGKCTLIVTVRESTSGEDKKEFTYELKRTKLSEPVVRVVNGVEYKYQYVTHAKAVKARGPKKNCPQNRPKSRGPMMKKSRRSQKAKAAPKMMKKMSVKNNKKEVGNNKNKMSLNNNKNKMSFNNNKNKMSFNNNKNKMSANNRNNNNNKKKTMKNNNKL